MSKNIFIDNIEYTLEQVLNNKELYEKHLKKLKYERDKIKNRENNNEYVKKRYHTNDEYRKKQLKSFKIRRDKIRELKNKLEKLIINQGEDRELNH